MRRLTTRLAGLALSATMLFTGCSRSPVMVEATPPPLPTPLAAPHATFRPVEDAELLTAADFNTFTLNLLKSKSYSNDTLVCGASAGAMMSHLGAYADENTLRSYITLLKADLPDRAAMLASVAGIQRQYAEGVQAVTVLQQHIAFGEGPAMHIAPLDDMQEITSASVSFVDFQDELQASSFSDSIRSCISPMPEPPYAVTDAPVSVIMAETVATDITWNIGFDRANTQKKIFRKADGSTTAVMMMQARIPMEYYADGDLSLGILPATDGREVWFIIPGSTSNLDLLVQSLTPEMLGSCRQNAQVKDCNLTLPIVKATFSSFLDANFITMGAGSLLSSEASAYPDLGDGIALTSFYQACSFSYDEDGISVSSAVGSSHELSPSPELIADLEITQPFVALVVDTEDGGILMAAAISGTEHMRVS